MKNNSRRGYVYILTNPSYRGDWVIIGKSLRLADIGSKELDAITAPLPFEVYATLKTSKYKQVERNLHEIFTDLGVVRIDKSQEFLNIEPKNALKYLTQQAYLLDDSELNLPDNIDIKAYTSEIRTHKSYLRKYVVNTDKIFYFDRDSVDARMKVIDGNKYIVLAGSKIDLNIHSNKETVQKVRTKYRNLINEDKITGDIEFSSPSRAGLFVAGGSVNGKFYWRTRGGKRWQET